MNVEEAKPTRRAKRIKYTHRWFDAMSFSSWTSSRAFWNNSVKTGFVVHRLGGSLKIVRERERERETRRSSCRKLWEVVLCLQHRPMVPLFAAPLFSQNPRILSPLLTNQGFVSVHIYAIPKLQSSSPFQTTRATISKAVSSPPPSHPRSCQPSSIRPPPQPPLPDLPAWCIFKHDISFF